jgi:hypothetical protein
MNAGFFASIQACQLADMIASGQESKQDGRHAGANSCLHAGRKSSQTASVK